MTGPLGPTGETGAPTPNDPAAWGVPRHMRITACYDRVAVWHMAREPYAWELPEEERKRRAQDDLDKHENFLQKRRQMIKEDWEYDEQNRQASHRWAMPYTQEQIDALTKDDDEYWDLGPYKDLPQNTPEEKEHPTPEYLHRGIRAKGPIRSQHINDLLSKGVGTHWTSDIQNAAAFADPDNHDEENDYPGVPKGADTGLIFSIKHPGAQYVNPTGAGVPPEKDPDFHWDEEHEHSLHPGTPIEVSDIHMSSPHPHGHKWTRLGPPKPGAHKT